MHKICLGKRGKNTLVLEIIIARNYLVLTLDPFTKFPRNDMGKNHAFATLLVVLLRILQRQWLRFRLSFLASVMILKKISRGQ